MITSIVGGKYKRRRLKSLTDKRVKPTSSLLRKVIFDLVGDRVIDAHLVDAFAGIGTLGIEALSRGARSCKFVEQNRGAARIIKTNIATLGEEISANVIVSDSLQYLHHCSERFDGILLDPPYHFDEALTGIDFRRVLKENGWLVYQKSSRSRLRFNLGSTVTKEKTHGNSTVLFYAL